MKVVVAGGTGQIGKALINELIARKHFVILLSRDPRNVYDNSKVIVKEWDGRTLGDWCEAIEGTDAIINLSGASIAGGRWTKSRKIELYESRIHSARILTKALSLATSRPSVFFNASAVGYYGNANDIEVNENSPPGKGFLADLCIHWEEEVLNARDFCPRVVLLRTGVVLDKNGGMLKKMIFPFKVFVGGHLGSGLQWISWIHIADVVKAILFMLESKSIHGPINLSSPFPVTMKVFAKKLGCAMHRPSWLPLPTILLKILLGEMSSVIIEGQRALPEKLISVDFTFTYPTVETAFAEIFSERH